MAKPRLEYLIFIAGLVAFHIFYMDHISFFVLVFFLVLPFLSLALSLISGMRVTASIEDMSGKTIGRGTMLPVRIRLTSRALFGGVRVFMKIRLTNEMFGTEDVRVLRFVTQKKTQAIVTQIECEQLGEVTAEIVKAKTFDFMGLFAIPAKIERRETSAYVIPGQKEIELSLEARPAALAEYSEMVENQPGSDFTEFFQVREFRDGDPVSRIHWKLSERLSTLMIREGSRPFENRVVLAIDLPGVDDEELTEQLLETFAAVSSWMTQAEIAHRILWWNESTNEVAELTIDNEGDYWSALFGLLENRWQPRREEVFASCLRLPENHSVYFFTSNLMKAEGARLRTRTAGNIRFLSMQSVDVAAAENAAGQEEGKASASKASQGRGRRRRSREEGTVTYLTPGNEAEILENYDWNA